ncbi:MAG: hypothetical protein BAA04_06100 [Firmicutes bacterium ZCTH02-B6]|nr:MAG: hypothetical protein BAA04_06100 [Firmicutes bacterium ZCTH02-B6]
MKLGAFLRDRAAYIASYAAFGLLCIVLVQLDLRLSGASLRYVNVVYLLILGAAILALFLLHDFQRSRRFYRRLEAAARAEGLAAAAALPEPASLEQRIVFDAWQLFNGRLQSELARERERGAARVAMISQWAHHMKTPVSVIGLELQKAARLPAEAELTAILASIAEEASHLDAQLVMLLNVNRLDDFAADLKPETVDLVALARGVINDNRRAFIAHRVYPRLDEPDPAVLSPERLRVGTDAKWLRLVLQQIISNAIKYAARPDRDGRVRVGFRQEGDETVLEVADDGVGIPAEDLGRVFEPFFTGANGRLHPRATGMGLYLAREVCRRLGHRITIASIPGQGTCVRLHFAPDPTLHAGLAPALDGER